MTFLNSVLNNSRQHKEPFKHWELNEPLSNEAITEILNADIPKNHSTARNECVLDSHQHLVRYHKCCLHSESALAELHAVLPQISTKRNES